MFLLDPQNHIYFERVCFALKHDAGQSFITVTVETLAVVRLCFVAMATDLKIEISVYDDFTGCLYGASSLIQCDQIIEYKMY